VEDTKVKSCPKKQAIAAVITSRSGGIHRKKLLHHISQCDKCRAEALRIAKIASVLPFATRRPDGSLTIEMPEPSPEFGEQLKQAVLKRFDERRTRLQTMRELVREIVARMAEVLEQRHMDLEAIGYAATLPGTTSLGRRRVSRKQEQAMQSDLAALLETLLDADVPLELRAKWLKRLQRLLITEQQRYFRMVSAGDRRRQKRSN
jgi:hypothetical protein